MEDNPKHLNIKSLAEDDRPREKMVGLGRHANRGSQRKSTVLAPHALCSPIFPSPQAKEKPLRPKEHVYTNQYQSQLSVSVPPAD